MASAEGERQTDVRTMVFIDWLDSDDYSVDTKNGVSVPIAAGYREYQKTR